MKNIFLKSCSISLIVLISSFVNLFSKSDNEIMSKLPELLGASNAGKEFWLTIPPCYEGESVGDNYIKIYVASETKTVVTVEVAGSGYSEQKTTIPNDVIVFSVSSHTACPWTKNGEKASPAEKVYPKAGIHIYSEGLLIVYVLFASEFSSESFLALPVSSIGKEYIVSTYSSNINGTNNMPCLSGCVAAFDNTTVKFTVGGNSTTKTAGGLKPGDTYTKVLQKGDVIMFAADGDGNDLTGSRWTANKPIAVVSGNFCANIPLGNNWCNYSVEMDFPTETWGMHYHVPKVHGRKYPSLIRVFAKEKNTKLLRNGVPVATLSESGGLQGKGWLEMRLVPIQQLPASAVISADKPISVTLFNTGTQEDGNPMPNSDPFALSITPVEQYQKEITFIMPQSSYINLVYMTDKNGIVPDDLEIAQVQSGEFNWEKIKTKYSSSDEIFASDVDGKKYAVKNIALSGGGTYKIRAANKFAAYMYGLSYSDIYSHPAAAGLKNLTKIDTIAPVSSYVFCPCHGYTHNASTTDYPFDSENRSNMALALFHSDSSKNFRFSNDEFIPGIDNSINWKLEIIDIEKNGRAVITFADRCGNKSTIVEYYDVFKINVTPENINWGIMKPNVSEKKEFVIKNENTERDARITRLSLKNGNVGFYFDNITVPIVLKPLEEKTIEISFKGYSPGEFIDSIGIGDTTFYDNLIELRATIGSPKIDITNIDFGYVKCGSSLDKEFIIANQGDIDLKITGYNDYLSQYFTHNLPVINSNNPLILHPGETKQYTITFEPIIKGVFRDSIVFISNAEEGDNSVIISAIAEKEEDAVVDELDNLLFSISPNPAGDNIEINVGANGRSPLPIDKIHIYNILGHCVFVGVQNLEPLRIDISNLPPGVYTLRCGSQAKMFVKE